MCLFFFYLPYLKLNFLSIEFYRSDFKINPCQKTKKDMLSSSDSIQVLWGREQRFLLKKKALQRTGKCERTEGVNGMFPLNTGWGKECWSLCRAFPHMWNAGLQPHYLGTNGLHPAKLHNSEELRTYFLLPEIYIHNAFSPHAPTFPYRKPWSLFKTIFFPSLHLLSQNL